MSSKDLIENYPDFFVSEVYDETLWLKFCGNFFHNIINFDKRDFLGNFFKKIRDAQRIKTVIIHSAYSQSGIDEYLHFFLYDCPESNLANLFPALSRYELHRFCNIIDQTILDITELNKFTVHICQGSTLSIFMNLGLACDYRIITDDTVFYNIYQEVGMLPKGGGPFFLSRMLGRGKANQLLLFNHQITADQAFEHGIVDHIAAKGHLEEVALKVAKAFNHNHQRTLHGMKKLMNFPVEDLKQYLAFETEEVLRIGVEMQCE